MREGGAKLGAILQQLLEYADVGVCLNDIELRANKLIQDSGGTPSFKTVSGYRWATCVCVNDVVVHGIPTPYKLIRGDILTIDIGLLYQGFHTDTAWTKIIGDESPEKFKEKRHFLEIGRKALYQAIDLCRIGNCIGDISESNQSIIEGAGFSVVKSLVGHGVGRALHEDPQIPNYIRGKKENTYKFQGGETIAIEPIYVRGNGDVYTSANDGWTIATRDGSPAVFFEHSIAVTKDGPIILTKAEL